MKDERAGTSVTECVCVCVCVRVRSKMYSMLKADENIIKKAKGVKRTLSERTNNASTVQGNAF